MTLVESSRKNASPAPGIGPLAMPGAMTDEMDRLFRRDGSEEGQAWAPVMDVLSCHGTLVVSAELPGLKREEVKVEIFEDRLVIEGERKQEHKEDHEGYHRWERSYGRFYRSVPLPEGARTDQAKAELEDGILKVTIPVQDPKKKSRQVSVAA